MNAPRAPLLVAGLGNVFLGDDGFGVEVVQRLVRRSLPAHVRLMDVGIRGLDLAYALLEGYAAVVLIDAVQRGNRPGTLYVIEPQLDPCAADEPSAIDAHAMDPVAVLRFARAQGAWLPPVRIVGCEPAGAADVFAPGLSDAVVHALDAAVKLVEEQIAALEVHRA